MHRSFDEPAKPVVVFDLDGTLADTILDLVPALNRTIVTQGLNTVTPAQIRHATATGLRSMIGLAYKFNDTAISQAQLDELFEICVRDYAQNLSTNTVLFPGAAASLQTFADHGWRLAVCTNKPVDLATKLLRDLGVSDKFAAITGGDSYSYRKPDPRHLEDTISFAGGNSRFAVMVGDTFTDIKAAKNANVPVVAVDFGYSEHSVSIYDPDRAISHFDELFDAANALIGPVA